MEHKSNCDSYNGKVEDISVDGSRNDTSTSAVEITDSDSDSSVGIRALQWVEVKNSGLPHSTRHLRRAQDTSG
jgi:hypothetical protein